MKSVGLVLLLLLTSFAHSETHHPQDFLQSIQGSKEEGKKIYEHFCVNCHALKPLIALGAPAIGVKKEWSDRLKKGMEAIFKNSSEGINAMPARGGCFECSDEQLKLAIEYLLPHRNAP